MFVIFQDYRGKSRVWFTRFEQRWNEDESSSVRRETVAFTVRVNPSLLEKQLRQQRRQQQSCVNASEDEVQLQNKKIHREERIWNTILGWQTCRRHSFETFTFKYVYFDTMMTVERENFQCWERRSVQNPKINWKENSRVRIDPIASTAEASTL